MCDVLWNESLEFEKSLNDIYVEYALNTYIDKLFMESRLSKLSSKKENSALKFIKKINMVIKEIINKITNKVTETITSKSFKAKKEKLRSLGKAPVEVSDDYEIEKIYKQTVKKCTPIIEKTFDAFTRGRLKPNECRKALSKYNKIITDSEAKIKKIREGKKKVLPANEYLKYIEKTYNSNGMNESLKMLEEALDRMEEKMKTMESKLKEFSVKYNYEPYPSGLNDYIKNIVSYTKRNALELVYTIGSFVVVTGANVKIQNKAFAKELRETSIYDKDEIRKKNISITTQSVKKGLQASATVSNLSSKQHMRRNSI